MDTIIKTNRLNATGTVFGGPGRIYGISWVDTGTTPSTLVFRDGGASGATVLSLDGGTTAGTQHYIDVPCGGIRCSTDIHVTIANVNFVTVFYA